MSSARVRQVALKRRRSVALALRLMAAVEIVLQILQRLYLTL